MADRARLLEILNKPIFPHEQVDPLEAVTDYLIDNDVIPVVRCKDCTSWKKSAMDCGWCTSWEQSRLASGYCHCGERVNHEES